MLSVFTCCCFKVLFTFIYKTEDVASLENEASRAPVEKCFDAATAALLRSNHQQVCCCTTLAVPTRSRQSSTELNVL